MKTAMEMNFEWYLEHQVDLVAKHGGKVLLIKDCKVVSVHDNELQALKDVSENHAPGTVLIQRCEPGSDSVTETYHSRVCFA